MQPCLQHGFDAGLHLTNLQFLPRTSCLGYSVSSMKPSDANTIGQSGKLGSQITKFCWILSTVVARSSATRGKAFGAVMRLPITLRCFSSASCRPAWEVWYVWQYAAHESRHARSVAVMQCIGNIRPATLSPCCTVQAAQRAACM